MNVGVLFVDTVARPSSGCTGTVHMLTASNNPSSWLEERDWNRVQAAVPIACVDVMPFQAAGSQVMRIGLIRRDTPHQGRRWCLIGGRLLRDESLADAVTRQLTDALGTMVTPFLDPDIQPVHVAQYFTAPREEGSFDPRQHAIGLIFPVQLEGCPEAHGEALEFRWFELNALPAAEEVGFGQDRILPRCIEQLDAARRIGRQFRAHERINHLAWPRDVSVDAPR